SGLRRSGAASRSTQAPAGGRGSGRRERSRKQDRERRPPTVPGRHGGRAERGRAGAAIASPASAPPGSQQASQGRSARRVLRDDGGSRGIHFSSLIRLSQQDGSMQGRR